MDDASMIRTPAELATPQVRLTGEVGDEMLRTFLDGVAAVEAGEGPLVLELTTTGGDADVGRRIATDVRLFRERTGRRTIFLGKAVVYSAGVTIMSSFPRADRWLSRGTALLIHCRQLNKTVTFEGPLKGARMKVEALLGEIDTGLDLEEQDFEALIEGSDVRMAELLERAQVNWYVHSDEALSRGLVAGLI
ncbi:peptidase S14 [Phenylobacterium sp. VNQ135]|uniref:peptidase S14 n=1 Tax=Phenylobacterium sp. VNQ135 TaxID=3400922 RepID=UPI003C0D4657